MWVCKWIPIPLTIVWYIKIEELPWNTKLKVGGKHFDRKKLRKRTGILVHGQKLKESISFTTLQSYLGRCGNHAPVVNGQIYDVGEEVGCRGAYYRQVKYSVKYIGVPKNQKSQSSLLSQNWKLKLGNAFIIFDIVIYFVWFLSKDMAMCRGSDPVLYWPADPDPTSKEKPEPDPTSQDKPHPDPWFFIYVFHDDF